MSSLRPSNGVEFTNTGNSSKIGPNRRYSLSTTDRAVTPAGTATVTLRNRGSRLSTVAPVASTDNANTTGAGRGTNAARRRKSLDKVCFSSHLRV